MIPTERALVIYDPFKPKRITWQGKSTIIYDYELLMMMIKQWRDSGLTREECMELIFS